MSENLLSISSSRDLEIYHESLEEYIKYFLYNRSYKMGCDIQYSRCGVELFEMSTKDMMFSLTSEEIVIPNINHHVVFLKVPYKILFGDERLDSLYIKQHFAGKKYKLIELQDKIYRTLDIFISGTKVISDEVSIILMEKYFIISLPSKYKFINDTPVYIVSRYYLKDIISHGKMKIYVDETFLNAYDDDEYELAVYINKEISYHNIHYKRSGRKTNNACIEIIDPKITTYLEDDVVLEVFYIKNFNYINGDIMFHNGYLEIERNGGFNSPLPTSNIYLFNNRYFTRLDITQVAGSIYKCLNIDPSTIKIFYFYDKEAYADISYKYYDHFQWYWDLFRPQIYNDILDKTKLPNLINNFYLFNYDISCTDYEYKRQQYFNGSSLTKLIDIFDYYNYRTKTTIIYDAETIQTYYTMLYEKMKVNLNKITNIEIPSINSGRSLFRNTTDIMLHDIDRTKYFNCDCIRIKYPNPRNHILLIYLDGLKFNGYNYMINVNGIQYIYLEASSLPTDLCNITIEELDTINRSEISSFVKPINKKQFIFSTKAGQYHEEDLRYLSIYKNITLSFGSELNIKIEDEAESISIEHTSTLYDTITINFKDEILDTYYSYLIINENFYDIVHLRTTRRGTDGVTLETNNMPRTIIGKNDKNVKDYFRVYRNNKLLPRNTYEIESLKSTYRIKITNSAEYNRLELFQVEYIPNREIELFYRENIGDLAEYDFINNKSDLGTLQKDDSAEFPLLLKENIKIVSNGRFLNKYDTKNSAKYKIWTTQGFTIHYTYSKKNLTVLCNYNALLYKYMIDKIEQYVNLPDFINKNYTQYINTTMVGGPLFDEEKDCRLPQDDNAVITEMWYDLYMEFLKHNLIDSSTPMPDYIAFKYNALENEEGTRIDVDMSDTNHLYWMPLDSTIDYSSSEFTKFENLYYKLLKDVANLEVLNSSEIPEDLYNKYKELFDNNTLLIQLPDCYKYYEEEEE